MKIFYVGSEPRSDIGCAASLRMGGYDVFYLNLGLRFSPLALRNVQTDAGIVKVPIMETRNLFSAQTLIGGDRFVPNIAKETEFDLVITSPLAPFYIAYNIAQKQRIPLILRVWGIRGIKLFDHLIYGRNYKELAVFLPSIIHNLIQANYSKAVVAIDCYTESFLRKLRPIAKKLSLIYPTYACGIYANDKHNEILTCAQGKEYIFGIVTLPRANSFTETNLLKILIAIAKRNPEINVLIAGTTDVEAKKNIDSFSLPKNMVFLGRVYSDDILRKLYINAKLVVNPIFYKSVSNRLLEALFYGKPVLTNSVAKLIHRELEHMHHILISDEYARYGETVRTILRHESLLEELSLGAKEAYSSFFSARQCQLKMKRVIEKLV
jgi:glycosyltransferase involved in cell wall biosynthesis